MDFFSRIVEQFIKANRKMKRWQRAVSILAACVVFTTTYALVLPAITLDKETASAQSGIEIAASGNEPESDGTVYEAEPEEEPAEEQQEEEAGEPQADGPEEPQDAEAAAEESGSESGSRDAEVSEEDHADEDTAADHGQNTEEQAGSEEAEDPSDEAPDVAEDDTVTAPAAETLTEGETLEEIRLITEETQLIYEYIDEEYEDGIDDENEDGIDDGYLVCAEFGADAKLPEGVELIAEEITKESDPEVYEAYYEKALSGLQDKYDENTVLSFARFYDIKFIYNGEEVEPAGDVKVRIEYKKAVEIEKETAVDAVHFDKNNDEEPEVIDSEATAEKKGKDDTVKTVEFESAQFSVFGIIGSYTVDFHWEVDGETYDFSIQGGGYVSFYDLVEILGIAEDDTSTETDEIRELVDGVERLEFSDPELVSVSKIEEDTTVEAIKDGLGLECEYSEELSEDEIAEINAQTLSAGDWVLISVHPFDTEEMLTVTMKNGEQFVVNVTDAHEVEATDELDPDYSYLISFHDASGYHVLKTDGTVETFSSTSNFDKLGSGYRWTFYYIFVEKDRETSLDYTYYFIRPVDQKTHTIALNEAGEELVQYGANNVAIIPKDGGFVFLGYNHTADKHIELRFEDGSFVSYNDLSEDPTVIQIFQQDPLPRYSFTVKTAEPSKGMVSGRDETGTQQNRVEQFIAESNDAKKNGAQITAVPETHLDTARHNKWIFDYWDMDGTKLEGVGATIPAGAIDIPGYGSVLTAHFKQNPAYIVPDSEKEGTTIESMREWLNELKNRNVPLNEAASNKTAEVYDYENRIYRVDFTAKSSLATFDGTIDLGFVLDVSASMNFPSYLYDSEVTTGIKDLSRINDRNAYGDRRTRGEREWGLNTNHTYYIISDPAGTATVCYLYYYQDSWWLCDASKDKYTGNGRFNPATGMSADNTQNYSASYYKTTNYVIMEAGDRVTAEDMATDGALLNKLHLGIGDPKSRAFYLEKSLNGTISELNEILSVLSIARTNTQDPDVKIAWNTFKNYLPNGSGQIQHNFRSVTSGINLNYDYNTYGGGTSTDVALLDAAGVDRNDVRNRYSDTDRRNWDTNNNVNHTYTLNPGSGFQWEGSTTKYAVLITDGAPQRGGNSITSRYVTEAAQQLKNRGVSLVTVGLGMDNVTSGKILLYNIADSLNNEKMFYSAKSGDELEDVLLQIVRTIMVNATVQGDVTDTIDQAFYPVDKATARPLKAGEMIDLEGNVTTDSSNPHGIITYDEAKKEYGVKWETQDFTWDGWQGTAFVKAKEDLLGGNAVRTDDGDAVIEAKSYTTSEDSVPIPLADKKYINDDPAQGEDPHYTRIVKRETPRVNINELSFTMNDTDWTVYLGTEVDPKEQLKKLWDNILVEEVIRKDHGVDNNEDSMPEIGSESDENTWYPIEENSITDNRESSGTGDKETFKINDLIRDLAELPGKTYNWWDYTKHEPNWNEFLTQALTDDGIVIDYDAYSLTDNDDSKITITLTKEILDGEEADLVNESPHKTTVVNDSAADEEEQPVDIPAEKYTLSVLYSPDYSVVPVGQGGSSTEDFHIGTYGTIYQGHAAGTEDSTNTHVINVYAEPLDVLKKDDHDAAVPGAVFKIYRAAKDGEEGEPLTTYDASLTGSYYCISTATSGADGIAHLAPDDITTPTHKIPVADGQNAQNLLVPGETYYLVEVSAPSGYKKDSTVRTVTVEAGPDLFTELDKTTLVDAGDISGDPPRPTSAYNWDEGVTITVKELGATSDENEAAYVDHETREEVTLTDESGEERTYMLRSDSSQSVVTQVIILNNVIVDIKIQKTDIDGEGLPGAVFQLKSVGEDGRTESDVEGVTGIGTVIKTIDGEERTFTSAFETTGEEQTFNNLPDGTYRLYEAYIPDGYIRTFTYIQFTLDNRVMKDVTAEGGDGTAVDWTPASGNKLALVKIKNTPGAALPNTGGSGTTMFYLIGLILTAIAGAGLVMRRKKKAA